MLSFEFVNMNDTFQKPLFPATYVLSSDKTVLFLMHARNAKNPQIYIQKDLKMKIFTKNFNTLDFLHWGKIMSNAMQEEIAFQCYYIAHLMDPENIKTNSDLEFSTFDPNKANELEE